MKKVMLLGLTVVGLVALFYFTGFAAEQPAPRTITVTGEAEVKVTPDEVVLSLGVETWDKDLNIAKKTNDDKIKKIIALAPLYKIDAKYIQTDYISIEPRYENSYGKANFIGYFVRKSVVITLKDISKFENLLSDCLTAGVNYVQGVQFRTTELRKFKDQARLMAINAAKEKAVDLAGQLGQKTGKPLSIIENSTDWYSWYGGGWGYRGWGNGMTQNVMQNAGGETAVSDSSIAPGQISIKARVSVTFELE